MIPGIPISTRGEISAPGESSTRTLVSALMVCKIPTIFESVLKALSEALNSNPIYLVNNNE